MTVHVFDVTVEEYFVVLWRKYPLERRGRRESSQSAELSANDVVREVVHVLREQSIRQIASTALTPKPSSPNRLSRIRMDLESEDKPTILRS